MRRRFVKQSWVLPYSTETTFDVKSCIGTCILWCQFFQFCSFDVLRVFTSFYCLAEWPNFLAPTLCHPLLFLLWNRLLPFPWLGFYLPYSSHSQMATRFFYEIKHQFSRCCYASVSTWNGTSPFLPQKRDRYGNCWLFLVMSVDLQLMSRVAYLGFIETTMNCTVYDNFWPVKCQTLREWSKTGNVDNTLDSLMRN